MGGWQSGVVGGTSIATFISGRKLFIGHKALATSTQETSTEWRSRSERCGEYYLSVQAGSRKKTQNDSTTAARRNMYTKLTHRYHSDPHGQGKNRRGRSFNQSRGHNAMGIKVYQPIRSLQHDIYRIMHANPHFPPLSTAVLQQCNFQCSWGPTE